MGLLLGMLFFLLVASAAASWALWRVSRRQRNRKPFRWALAALSVFGAALALCAVKWRGDLLSFF